jgi:hypothetical protein
MKSLLMAAVAAVVFSVSATVVAQAQPDRAKRSEEIMRKMRQLDLLNHILPLVMSKDQITAILAPIEKARQNVKKIETMEADDLLKYEARINEMVEKGTLKNEVPSREFLRELNRLYSAFTVRRMVAAAENADLVLEVVKKKLNKGQIAAMANSLDPKVYGLDPKTASEDDKLKNFIKDVLLDPTAYPILLQLQKIAPVKEGDPVPPAPDPKLNRVWQ